VTVLFISDLHLETDRPATTARFLSFLERDARRAQSLYILGDLFEAWVGDDDDDPGLVPILDALAGLTAAGVDCRFMHGNRDFLVGERFAARTGCTLLGDYATVDLHGRRVLITHGDLLCTDDTKYLAMRAQFRDPAWQHEFLAKPLAERRGIAQQLRAMSATEVAMKSESIMDVNQAAVEQTMRANGVDTLLHGHTHRPNIHRFDLDGRPATRLVLGAWHDTAEIIVWSSDGPDLKTL
jgi:UDP-2,3-diacylglucosamine hydrolase